MAVFSLDQLWGATPGQKPVAPSSRGRLSIDDLWSDSETARPADGDEVTELVQKFSPQPAEAPKTEGTGALSAAGSVISDLYKMGKGTLENVVTGDISEENKEAFRRVHQDLSSNMLTRIPTQAALGLGTTVTNLSTLRPLGVLGVSGASEFADKIEKQVQDIGQQNAEKAAAESLIGEWFGPTAAQMVEGGATSIVEFAMGGAATKTAGGTAKALKSLLRSPTKAGMTYAALSGYDAALPQARDMGLEGPARQAYAAINGGIEAALMGVGAKLGKAFGVDTAEEAILRTAPMQSVREAFKGVLTKSGATELLGKAFKGAEGALLEGGEEYFTELGQIVNKAAFDGSPEGAVDRILAELEKPETAQRLVLAAGGGVAARGVASSVKAVSAAVQKAAEAVPGAVDNLIKKRYQERAEQRLAESRGSEVSSPPVATDEEIAGVVGIPPTAEASVPTATEVAMADEAATGGEVSPAAPPPEGGRTTPADDPVPDYVSPHNAAMAKQAARMFGYAEPYSPDRTTFENMASEAAARGMHRNALATALSIKDNPRVVTDLEEAAFGIRAVELDAAYRARSIDLQNAETALLANPADSAARADWQTTASQMNALETEFNAIKSANELAGTKLAQAFVARQMKLGDDYGTLTILSRASAAKGRPLSAQERADIVTETENIRQLQQQAAASKEKLRQTQADAMFEGLRKLHAEEILSDGELDTAISRLKNLLDKGCDLI